MSKLRILGVAALSLLTLARDSTAQRGGAVRTGARGAVVGGLVGGESGAATGAKIGVVTGAARSVGQECRRAPSTKLLRLTERSALGFQSSTPGGSGRYPVDGDCSIGGDCPTGGDRAQSRGCPSEEWKARRWGHTPSRLEADHRSQPCLRR